MNKMAMMAMNPLEMLKAMMNVEYFTVDKDDVYDDDEVCMDVPRRTMMGSPFDESCKKVCTLHIFKYFKLEVLHEEQL